MYVGRLQARHLRRAGADGDHRRSFISIVWGPLNDWSVRFLYDTADTPAPQTSRAAAGFAFTWPDRRCCTSCGMSILRPIIRSMVFFLSLLLERQRTRRGNVVLVVLLIVLRHSVWSEAVWSSATPSADPVAGNACRCRWRCCCSFLRLLAAYALALVWTLPLAVWVGRNEHISRRVLPILEVVASIPATAFFPLIVLTIIRHRRRHEPRVDPARDDRNAVVSALQPDCRYPGNSGRPASDLQLARPERASRDGDG